MPDLPNRAASEAELSAALYLLFAEHEARALALLADSSDPSRLTPEFWQAMQTDIEDALAVHLSRIHEEAAQRMAAGLGLPGSLQTEVANAYVWATQRGYELSTELVANVQASVTEAIARVSLGEVATLGVVMAALLGPDRAARISATEITNAVSAGEFDQRDALEERYGVTIVAIWNTRDNDACRTCTRMNRLTEVEFSRYYPSGPGDQVHPTCRCFLTWEII